MEIIESYDLLNIKGGTSISATMINAISRFFTVILDLGRTIGSSIYRYQNNNYCR